MWLSTENVAIAISDLSTLNLVVGLKNRGPRGIGGDDPKVGGRPHPRSCPFETSPLLYIDICK